MAQIIIYDTDMPITVAEKLITATKPLASEIQKKLSQACGGNGEKDFFNEFELLEIAEHLRLHCKHSEGLIDVKDSD